MLVVENGKIIEEYDEFINIGKAISPKIVRLTGITNDMLRNEGQSEERIARDLKERMTEGTVMIAHNTQFDLSFIFYLLSRHYPKEAYDIIKNVKWLDTLTVLKDRKKYPHKLIDGVNYYGLEKVNFHRAIDDTKALKSLTLAMKKERDDLGEYVNVFGYNDKYGISGLKLPRIIEYKAQPFRCNNGRMVGEDEILPKLD